MEHLITCIDLCYESYFDQNCVKVDDLYYTKKTRNGTTYIAIRGTDNNKNVARDLRVFPSKTPKGFLGHKGFISAFKVLQDHFKDLGDNVVFTGHSLGGAIAVLLGEAFDKPVVSFGCPRVYFKFFKGPSLNHYRVICDDDPVPMIPKLLYKHLEAPSLILHDNDGGIDIKDHNINVYKNRVYAYTNNYKIAA